MCMSPFWLDIHMLLRPNEHTDATDRERPHGIAFSQRGDTQPNLTRLDRSTWRIAVWSKDCIT